MLAVQSNLKTSRRLPFLTAFSPSSLKVSLAPLFEPRPFSPLLPSLLSPFPCFPHSASPPPLPCAGVACAGVPCSYHPLPVVFSKAQGAQVWDPEGRHYLDCLSAYSAVNQVRATAEEGRS